MNTNENCNSKRKKKVKFAEGFESNKYSLPMRNPKYNARLNNQTEINNLINLVHFNRSKNLEQAHHIGKLLEIEVYDEEKQKNKHDEISLSENKNQSINFINFLKFLFYVSVICIILCIILCIVLCIILRIIISIPLLQTNNSSMHSSKISYIRYIYKYFADLFHLQ